MDNPSHASLDSSDTSVINVFIFVFLFWKKFLKSIKILLNLLKNCCFLQWLIRIGRLRSEFESDKCKQVWFATENDQEIEFQEIEIGVCQEIKTLIRRSKVFLSGGRNYCPMIKRSKRPVGAQWVII
jgi:hypothetical protein